MFGADGMPQQNGTAEYEFLVIVPKSATTGTPGAPLQIGHGLFGRLDPGREFRRVRQPAKLRAFGHGSDRHVDRGRQQHRDHHHRQGHRQVQERRRSTRPGIAQRPARDAHGYRTPIARPGRHFGGRSAIKTDERYYLGGSQGGIFGASYMAISTDVTRGVLACSRATVQPAAQPQRRLRSLLRGDAPVFPRCRSICRSRSRWLRCSGIARSRPATRTSSKTRSPAPRHTAC